MIPFSYKDKNLFCEDTNLTEIAEQFGTPTYVYSKKSLLENFSKIDKAFGDYPHKICFALKSNSNKPHFRAVGGTGRRCRRCFRW